MSKAEQNWAPVQVESPWQVRAAVPTREKPALQERVQVSLKEPGTEGVDPASQFIVPSAGFGSGGHETKAHTAVVPDQDAPMQVREGEPEMRSKVGLQVVMATEPT